MKPVLRYLLLALPWVVVQQVHAEETWYRYFPRSGICVRLWHQFPVPGADQPKKSQAQVFYGIFRLPPPDNPPARLPSNPAEVAEFLNNNYSGEATLEPLTELFASALQTEESLNDVGAQEQATTMDKLGNGAYLLTGTYRPHGPVGEAANLEQLALVLVTKPVCEWLNNE